MLLAMNSNNQSVFEDIMEALHEIEEHQEGKIKLNSNTVIIPSEETEAHQAPEKARTFAYDL